MGVLTASGGACDIIADAASAEGLEIPPFARHRRGDRGAAAPVRQRAQPAGRDRLRAGQRRTTPLTAIDHALDAAVQDPDLDFVLFTGVTLPEARPPDEAAAALETRVDWLAERMAGPRSRSSRWAPPAWTSPPTPANCWAGTASTCSAGWNWASRPSGMRWAEAGRGQVRLLSGRAGRRGRQLPPGPRPARATCSPRRVSRSCPAGWRLGGRGGGDRPRVGMPVALKICSAQITHKSDIGGVLLGLSGGEPCGPATTRFAPRRNPIRAGTGYW